MMMKIEKLLTISDKDVIRVQDFNDSDKKMIDKGRFREGKSQRNLPRLEADVIVVLKEDLDEMEIQMTENISKIQSLEEALLDKDKNLKKLEERLSDIYSDHQKEIDHIKEENHAKVNQLKETIHDKELEIEKTKTKYAKEIGDINAENQKKINDLELFNKSYHMKKEDHQKALNKMRGNCLKLRVKDNKAIDQYIKELEGLSRLDKFRHKDKEVLKKLDNYNKKLIDEEAIEVQFNLIDEGNPIDDEE